MKRLTNLVVTLFVIISYTTGYAQARFGEHLCHEPDYFCLKVKPLESWEKLFPNAEERDLVMRVNRMNVSLYPGMTIAVPKNIERLTIYDVAPFPRYIQSNGEKTILVSQKQLAWGAYDQSGELVWWGPVSPGKGGCAKLDGNCLTPSGSFRVIDKQDIDCISNVFPQRVEGQSGGAAMPFCMYFFKGYALHGSNEVPGYRASHGCVRLFIEDAKWLNEEFITLPDEEGNKGTRVVVDALGDE